MSVVVNNDGIFAIWHYARHLNLPPYYIHFAPGRTVEPRISEPPTARHIQGAIDFARRKSGTSDTRTPSLVREVPATNIQPL